MNQPIIELYAADRLARLERKRTRTKRLLWALALGALAVCVVLCTRVNTRNLYQMLLACIGVSVGAAWVIIYFGVYTVRDGGRELAHARHLAEGPRETVEGRVTLQRLKVRVRNSITLRKLRVETAEGPVSLNVHIDKTEELRRAGEWLRLYTVHGYVVAWQRAEGGERRADS